MFKYHSLIPWGSIRGPQEDKWGSFRGRDHFGGCAHPSCDLVIVIVILSSQL